jgi:predicted nucleic acid-binding protein
VLLYLGRIDQAQLLPALFGTVYVPDAVATELDMGRLLRPDTISPREIDWLEVVAVAERDIGALPSNRLGAGERAVIAYVGSHPNCMAGLDDRQARELAEDLDLDVIGTIGILLRAKKVGNISDVQPLLNAVCSEGFHVGDDLYRQALELAGEL